MTDSWLSVALGDVASEVRNRVQPAELDPATPYVGLEHIDGGLRHIARFGLAADVESQKSTFEAGDVLFGKLRPYLRKIAVAEQTGICSTDILVYRTADERRLDQFFLYYVLASAETIAYAVERSAGTRMPRVSAQDLAHMEIRLPPLPEQRRIAGVLMAADDAALAAARHQQAASQLFRAWREELLAGLGPEVLGALLLGIDAGRSPDCAPEAPPPDKWGVLKVTAVRADRYHPREMKTLPEGFENPERFQVREGDLLVTRAGGNIDYVGVSCIVDVSPGRAMLCDKTLRLRVAPDRALSRYVSYALGARSSRTQLMTFATGGAGQLNISQAQFRAVRIPCPSLEVQAAIVARLDAAMGVARAAEGAEEKARRARDALSNALLTGRRRVRPESEGPEEFAA